MKKTITAIMLFSMFLILMPFIVKAQDKAKVTVTINSLTALSTDACNGKMDFYAKIHIGEKVKTFPVREGNNLRGLNWQFTTTTRQDLITPIIEIWDDDEAVCGGGDDEVCVSGNSYRVRQSLSTREYKSQDYISSGDQTCNYSERAKISYNITIEPIKSKTELLTQGIWKHVISEHKSRESGGIWLPNLLPVTPDCKSDDQYVFRVNATYERNEGAAKCAPTDPQIIATGTWNFLIRETRIQLTMTGSSLPLIYSVDQLDENNLSIIRENSSGGITNYTRITYRH